MKTSYFQYFISILALFFLEFQLALTQADKCEISNCLECLSEVKICTKCDNNMIFDRLSSECRRRSDQLPSTYYDITNSTNNFSYCHPSCKSCTGSLQKDCIECSDGYRPIEDSENQFIKCISCRVDNCIKCNQLNICTICQKGYFLDTKMNKCFLCEVKGCLDCSSNIKSCQKCLNPWAFNQNTQKCEYQPRCQPGQYLSVSNQCLQCDKSCKTCYDSGNNSCYECKEKFFFNTQNKCVECNPDCAICKNFESNCISCTKNNLLGNRCLDSCSIGYYPDNKICKPCKSECADCFSYDFCNRCIDNSQYTLIQGSCIKKCQEGEYNLLNKEDQEKWLNQQYDQISPNVLTQCKKCSPICKTCVLYDNRCSSCDAGYVLFQNKCLFNCPSKYYKSIDQNQQPSCQKCPFPCVECTSKNVCLSCQNGFSLRKDGFCGYDELIVGQCTEEQYQFQSICFNSCPAGSLVIGKTCFCQNGCDKCSYSKITNSLTCNKCLNSNQYTYLSQCVSQCPPLSFIQELPIKACTNFCSGNQVRQILLRGRYCSDTCDSQTTKSQGVCNQVKCKSNEYFDNQDYQAQLLINQFITNPEQFCKTCYPSCESCTGPSEIECTACKQNIIVSPGPLTICPQNCGNSQNKSLVIYSLPNSKIMQVLCLSCQDGYQFQEIENIYDISSYMCILNTKCNKNEVKILLNDTQNNYWFQCKQQKVCSIGTQPNYKDDKCDLQQNKFFLTLDNTKQLQNKYTYQQNYTFKFENAFSIFYQINFIQLNGQEISFSQDQQSSQFVGVLTPQNFMNVQYENELLIDFQIEKTNYQISKRFQILQIINGSFSIFPQKGIAEKDEFTISIRDFLIDGLSFEDYTFNFKILAEYKQLNRIDGQNITLFMINQSYLQQNSNPLQLNLKLKFPNVPQNQSIKIYLVVYNELASTSQSAEIFLEQYKVNDAIISPILNYTINKLTIPQNSTNTPKPWEGYFLTYKLMLNNIIQQIDNSDYSTKLQKLLSGTTYFRMNCQNACSNTGHCLEQAPSYYSRCTCDPNFSGEACQWKIQDLEYLLNEYDQALQHYTSEFEQINQKIIFDQQRFITALQTLEYIASFRDYFNNVSKVNQFIDIISDQMIYQCFSQYQAITIQFSTLKNVTEILLGINDKAFELIKKVNSDIQKNSEQIINNVHKILSIIKKSVDNSKERIYRYASNYISASIHFLTQEYQNEYNFEAKDLSYVVTINKLSLDQFFSRDVSIQIISFPFISKFIIYNPQNYTIPSSRVVDFSVYLQNKNIYQQVQLPTSQQVRVSIPHYVNQLDPYQFGRDFKYQIVCGFQPRNYFSERNFNLSEEKSSGTISTSNCYSSNLERVAIFIRSPCSKINDEAYGLEDEDEKKIQFILTLTNALVIFGVGFGLALIMSKVKKFRTIQQYKDADNQSSDSEQVQNGNVEQDNKANDVKESIALPQEVVIEDAQDMVVVGEIVEERNRNQRLRKNKAKPLPINQIEIDIRKQLDYELENIKLDQTEVNIAPHQRDETFISHDQVIRPISTHKALVRGSSNEISFNTHNNIKSKNLIKTAMNSTNNINVNQLNQNEKTKMKTEEVELPQGIPINDLRKKIKEMKEEKLRRKQDEMERVMQIQNYHPLKSFTVQLQYIPVSVRIVIFFSNLALIEWMVITFYLNKNIFTNANEQIQRTESFSLTVIQAIATKNIMQYIMPLSFFTFSYFEKSLCGRIVIFDGMIIKCICITLLSAFAIYRIDRVAQSLNYEDISNFIGMFCSTVAIDMIILDYLVLYCLSVLKKCGCFIKLVKLKNYDYIT